MSVKPGQNARSIGARFRSARSLVLNHNRKSFCELYEINRYTMQSWENGLHVSKGKNVEKFIEALACEGIACTAEWLIDGTGEPAKPFEEDASSPLDLDKSDDGGLLKHVVHFYKQQGENTATCRINDDAIMPYFSPGDLVLGIDISEQPDKAHQKWCIVGLSPGRQVVRKVIVFKDHLILMANHAKTPSFTLGLGAKIYEIVCHQLNQ
jgi:hypothetical protein